MYVDVPAARPEIHNIKQRYRLGDIVRGNCTSKPSRPAANLTWTINDIPVSIQSRIFLWSHIKSFFTLYCVLNKSENLCIEYASSRKKSKGEKKNLQNHSTPMAFTLSLICPPILQPSRTSFLLLHFTWSKEKKVTTLCGN